MITLEGIAWNHTRGYVPNVAVAQRFAELHSGVEVRWSRRSLREFGESPVEQLAARFDLLVIDHPSIGAAAEGGVLLPLDDLLPAGFLHELEQHSVGASHASYRWADQQWALAVDAACPVAHWRQDLLDREGVGVPQTWDDVAALIRHGRVIVPLIHTDAIHVFFMFCHALGETPFARGPGEPCVTRETGATALDLGCELARSLPPACLDMNPIATLEALARDDDAWWYCPIAFGYGNYARAGYGARVVHSGDLVTWRGLPLITTLGGAGIAISSRCTEPEEAAQFVAFLASERIQRGLYFDSGGQPGHRAAWLDDRINAVVHDSFRRALPALDRAWLRPRYAGYLHFQDHGAHVVADCFRGGVSPITAWERLVPLQRGSRRG